MIKFCGLRCGLDWLVTIQFSDLSFGGTHASSIVDVSFEHISLLSVVCCMSYRDWLHCCPLFLWPSVKVCPVKLQLHPRWLSSEDLWVSFENTSLLFGNGRRPSSMNECQPKRRRQLALQVQSFGESLQYPKPNSDCLGSVWCRGEKVKVSGMFWNFPSAYDELAKCLQFVYLMSLASMCHPGTIGREEITFFSLCLFYACCVSEIARQYAILWRFYLTGQAQVRRVDNHYWLL